MALWIEYTLMGVVSGVVHCVMKGSNERCGAMYEGRL